VVGLDLGRQFLQSVRAAGGEDDVRALGCECSAGCRTDAAACARDDGRLLVEWSGYM